MMRWEVGSLGPGRQRQVWVRINPRGWQREEREPHTPDPCFPSSSEAESKGICQEQGGRDGPEGPRWWARFGWQKERTRAGNEDAGPLRFTGARGFFPCCLRLGGKQLMARSIEPCGFTENAGEGPAPPQAGVQCLLGAAKKGFARDMVPENDNLETGK